MRTTGLRRAGSGCLFGILIFVAAVGFAVASLGVISTIVGAVLVVAFVAVGYIAIRIVK